MPEPFDPATTFQLTPQDLDNAWELFQGLQTVSYQEYSATTDLPTTTHTGIQALTEMEERKEIEINDVLSFQRTRPFNLRVANFVGVEVTKRGRIIEANGTIWVVITAKLKSWKTRWTCECYALEG